MDERPLWAVRSLGRSTNAHGWDPTPKRKDLTYIPPDCTPLPTKMQRIWAVEHESYDVVSSDFIRANSFKEAAYSAAGKAFVKKHFGVPLSRPAATCRRLYRDAKRKEARLRANDEQQLAEIKSLANMSHTKQRSFVCGPAHGGGGGGAGAGDWDTLSRGSVRSLSSLLADTTRRRQREVAASRAASPQVQ